MTATVIDQFVEKIDKDTEYTVSELKKVLGEVYKSVQLSIVEKKKAEKLNNGDKPRKVRTKRERDENGEIIKKRAPSAYNLFIKEQSALIKQSNADLDPKIIFKMAIAEWKKKKLSEDEADAVEPVKPVDPVKPHVDDDDVSNPVVPDINNIMQASQPVVLKPKKTAGRKPKKAAADDDEM